MAMSIDEMKWAITSSLNQLPEKTLEEFLKIIQEQKPQASTRYDINSDIELILHEDAELLKRLAE